MNWADAHREAMFAAAEAHEDLDVDCFGRIDVFRAIDRAGLKLSFRPIDHAALYIPPLLGGRPGVLVNSNHPLALQRYSGGHELGHHRFQHGPRADRETDLRGTRRPLAPEEMLAESFAAWFLMPPEAADVALAALGIQVIDSPAQAYQLALRVGASYSATCVHLPSLDLAAGPSARAWRSLELKALKQELTADPPVGGWRQDVWALCERDAEAAIVARPGDRLIFSTPGARWSAGELPGGVTVSDGTGQTALLAPLVVDVDAEARTGPRSLKLELDGQPFQFELIIEFRGPGAYVPAAEVAAR